MDNLHQELERLRMQAGVTVTAVAKYLGIAQSSMSRKFQGEQPWKPSEVLRFCQFVGGISSPPMGMRDHYPRRQHLQVLIGAIGDVDEEPIAQAVYLLVTGCKERLKPGGLEALSALKALHS